MNLVALKITPRSAFSTIPKGDTLFGQILSYLFLKGDTTFANYLNEEPRLVVSDMMPLGYLYKPNLPLQCFKFPQSMEESVDKKSLRKKRFIRPNTLQLGNLYECEDVETTKNTTTVHNKINRITFSTDGADFAPYTALETLYFKELWLLILVDAALESTIIDTIREIGNFGFGNDANLGKGQFDLEAIEHALSLEPTGYYMSLSPTLLYNQHFEHLWYEPFTRFGKYGLQHAHHNAFKPPVLMADSAAVVKSSKSLEYFGSALDNGNSDTKPSFLQGYSIALPIVIKDEACLNIS